MLCSGFPCQSFSVAGKRKGFEDARGTLFFDIARVADAKRPPLLLLENVKGLLSVQGGYCFGRILDILGELGYWVEWQVLNSKHFGVPQNRERVFIVGHLGERGGREVFPVGEPDGLPVEDVEGGQGISSCLDANYHKGARRQRQFVMQLVGDRNDPSISVKDKAFCLPSNPMSDRQQAIVVGNVYSSGGEAGKIHRPEGIMSTVKHGKHTGPALFALVRWQNKKDGAVVDDKAPALRSSGGTDIRKKPVVMDMNYRIRRLTPVECERLQGFPDGWTEGLPDTQRYRLLGNAITVNVAEFLGRRIMGRCLDKEAR